MKRATAIAFALFSVACSAHSPAPTAADLQVPPHWGTAGVSQSQPPEQWWNAFGDQVLSELVTEALAHNRDLHAAAARVAAAAAAARIEGAPRLPSVSASATGTRQRRNFVGFPDFRGTGTGSTVFSTTFNQFGVSLDVSWELDLWGRLAAGHRAARAELQASQADLYGARLSLAAQTAKAWFAAIEALRQLDLARSTEASYRTSLDRVAERYRRGVRPVLDLRLARSELAGAQALVQERQRRFDAARRQLEVLLGRYPAAAIETAASLPVLSADEVPAGLPAELVARRPDLVAAAQRLESAAARTDAAKASLLPRISLTGSRGRVSDTLSDLTSGQFGVWALAANLVQPVFEGGRLRAAVDLARAKEDEARAAYVQAALRAFAEVESLLVADRTERERERALEQSAEEAEAAWRLAVERYESGLDDYITVLAAERSALSARSRHLAAQRERLDTRIDLYLALGGGFIAEPVPAARRAKPGTPVAPARGGTKTSVSAVVERVRPGRIGTAAPPALPGES